MLRVALTSLMAFVVLSSQVFAWHDGGHKIVASIAFRRLSKPKQDKVVALLNQHPRFQEAFTDQRTPDVDDDSVPEFLFHRAAVFPDLAKKKANLSSFDHKIWHYINQPLFLSPADRAAMHPETHLNLKLHPPATLHEDANVIQVIRFARKTIKIPSADPSERALFLSWLMHTVGDIHQPLHSTALFSQVLFNGKHGDRGGNDVLTTPKQNLHSLWDDFPGGSLKFKTVRNRAIALMANNDMAALGAAAVTDLDETTWMKESQMLAESDVYSPEITAALKALEETHADHDQSQAPIHLSDDYLQAGAALAEKRVVQAGFRLGAVLDGLFD